MCLIISEADEYFVLRAGIPALYFCLLYRRRDQIRRRDDNDSATNKEAIAHLRFLFDSYEPRCMYFEIVETFRKLLLTGAPCRRRSFHCFCKCLCPTGMLVFFFPETPSQIVVGLLLAFVSTCIYARHKPFVQSEDDFVSNIAQCQIFFILLSAMLSLMSSTYDSHDENAGDLYSEVLFGWLMVGVSLVAPGIATAMAFREWLSRLWELPAQLHKRLEAPGRVDVLKPKILAKFRCHLTNSIRQA